MTPLHPLTVLLDQNERKRDAAMAEHLRAVSASRAASVQAEQLRTYRQEYERRWSTQFALEGKIEVVRCYQSFMERLTQAVEHQVRVEQHAALQVEQALLTLREAEMRCASVRKLIERRTHEHRQAADRHDQKQSDEFAARVAWNRRAGNGQPRLN
jgi:flagellar FliJ protein